MISSISFMLTLLCRKRCGAGTKGPSWRAHCRLCRLLCNHLMKHEHEIWIHWPGGGLTLSLILHATILEPNLKIDKLELNNFQSKHCYKSGQRLGRPLNTQLIIYKQKSCNKQGLLAWNCHKRVVNNLANNIAPHILSPFFFLGIIERIIVAWSQLEQISTL